MKVVATCPRCGDTVLVLKSLRTGAWHAVDLAPSQRGTVTIDENARTYTGYTRITAQARRMGILHSMHAATCHAKGIAK
jgi:hypothetical protein